MQQLKNNYTYCAIILGFALIAIISCHNSRGKVYCVDTDICYKTEYYNKTYSDSVRTILFKNVEIGKEVFVKDELDSIIIKDLDKLKIYYSDYRHLNYVGMSLFTSRCLGCHNFYPDIVKDLSLTDSLQFCNVKKILDNTHGKIILNSIELEAIYEYIKPKRNIIMPR